MSARLAYVLIANTFIIIFRNSNQSLSRRGKPDGNAKSPSIVKCLIEF